MELQDLLVSYAGTSCRIIPDSSMPPDGSFLVDSSEGIIRVNRDYMELTQLRIASMYSNDNHTLLALIHPTPNTLENAEFYDSRVPKQDDLHTSVEEVIHRINLESNHFF